MKSTMNMSQMQENQSEAPEGAVPAPADYFTGKAWIKTMVPPNDLTDTTLSDVTFDPGARNNWHTHPNGQILIATKGVGYYQEKGKPIQLFQVGEAINIAPDVVHWHGASPDSRFTHLAINPNVSKGGAVIWLDRVTDEEYNLRS